MKRLLECVYVYEGTFNYFYYKIILQLREVGYLLPDNVIIRQIKLMQYMLLFYINIFKFSMSVVRHHQQLHVGTEHQL